VLSVFNGLEGLLRSLYSSFDPEIKIEASQGKSFVFSDSMRVELEKTDGVGIITEVIEDYAYVKYREADMVVTIKGVSENFIDQERLDDAIVSGELQFKNNDISYAIIGRGIQYALSIVPGNDLYPLQVHYIKNAKIGSIDVSKLYSSKNILPGAVFAIEKNYDENYIFVPLDFAESLLDYGEKRTSLEIKTKEGYSIKDVKTDIKSILGKSFIVKDNEEIHADLYKILKLEKLFVFIAFAFILIVGSINIFFALTMLALDKKKDIAVLFAMGAPNRLIKRIFITEGAIISLGGALIGLALGAGICYAQQTFGLISMGMETSILENYPVEMEAWDFIITSISLIVITLLISYRPAIIATRYNRVDFLQ